jgi:imidazole glycerol-phosphate synthase subunit HisF
VLRPRITPCLLVRDGGLVKTVRFQDAKYVGDPINAVKIFNEKAVDELMLVDIDATARGREPDLKMIARTAVECRMPFCYGGGIRTPAQAKQIIALGVEKVAISAAAIESPGLLAAIAEEIGSQSVVLVLDVRRKRLGRGYQLYTHNGQRRVDRDPFELVAEAASLGVGEIVVNSIDHDGRMQGYDLDLAARVRAATTLPMTALGGAGSLADIEALLRTCGVIGAAAGSLFVFKGAYKAVLINYPTQEQRDALVRAALRN